MSDKTVIKVVGMSCEHCEKRVEKAVLAVSGVLSCKADAKEGVVEITTDGNESTISQAKEAIADAGYDITT